MLHEMLVAYIKCVEAKDTQQLAILCTDKVNFFYYSSCFSEKVSCLPKCFFLTSGIVVGTNTTYPNGFILGCLLYTFTYISANRPLCFPLHLFLDYSHFLSKPGVILFCCFRIYQYRCVIWGELNKILNIFSCPKCSTSTSLYLSRNK
jgi:hypothetical protein